MLQLPWVAGRGARGGSFAAGPAAPAADTGATRADALVHWWKLDEGTGTTFADSVGSDHITTSEGDPAWTSSAIDGNAVEFDGLTDVIYEADGMTAMPADTAFTMSCWCYPTASGVDFDSPFGVFENINNGNGVFLTFGNGDHFSFYVNQNGSNWANTDWTDAQDLNKWYFLAGVFDPTSASADVKLYWAKVEDGGVTTEVTEDGNQLFRAGADTPTIGGGYGTAPSATFQGRVDDCRIYNAALNKTDVDLIYGGGSGDF